MHSYRLQRTESMSRNVMNKLEEAENIDHKLRAVLSPNSLSREERDVCRTWISL